MTRPDSRRYLRERSQALAIMHLTRREDLEITEATRATDGARELLVRIEDPEKSSERYFGVAVRGSMNPTTIERANLTPLKRRTRGLVGLSFPICLFLFTMADDRGYFTWLWEPVIEGDTPGLRQHASPDFATLDRDALDGIVSKINRWYDKSPSLVKS